MWRCGVSDPGSLVPWWGQDASTTLTRQPGEDEDVLLRGWRREERLMWKLVGKGSRKGASAPSRAGDVLRQPVVWIASAGALALSGPRGRRAALRGATCSLTASLIHLPIKRVFRRRRPLGAGVRSVGPLTSSFPSGHTASDLGFMFGAAQELPLVLIPLTIGTLGSHWSLLRARKHYPSDIVAGGAIRARRQRRRLDHLTALQRQRPAASGQ
jgi:hypothetical protein